MPRIGVRRVWLSVAIVISFLAAVGCTSHQDERAYSGSRSGVTLDDILRDYSLPMPKCTTTGLRYFATETFSGGLYLRFDADKACVNQYLEQLGISNLSLGKGAGVPFGRYECDKLGWCLDPVKSYDYYSTFTTPNTEVALLVDTNKDPEGVYVTAVRM